MFRYLLLTLLLSIGFGLKFVFRTDNSEVNFDGPALTAFVLIVYSLVRLWKLWKLIRTFPGKTLRFPQHFYTPLEGTWVAIIPGLFGIHYIGEMTKDMYGKMSPSWEFTWGMSPALPYAACALIAAIVIQKLNHIFTNATLVKTDHTFLS